MISFQIPNNLIQGENSLNAVLFGPHAASAQSIYVGIKGDKPINRLSGALSGEVGKRTKWTENLTAKCCRWPRFRWHFLPGGGAVSHWRALRSVRIWTCRTNRRKRLVSKHVILTESSVFWAKRDQRGKGKSRKYVARMFFNPSWINRWFHQSAVSLTEHFSLSLDSTVTVWVGDIYSATGFYILLFPVL